jgi:quaternary ammonium compound-resistance protein SugE
VAVSLSNRLADGPEGDAVSIDFGLPTSGSPTPNGMSTGVWPDIALGDTLPTMHWTLLFFAAALEIVWATGLKSTDGFTRPWPSIGVGTAMVASMFLLALAARGLPIGTAYAVWTGIGAAGTAIGGILFFGESASPARIACLTLIVGGVVGLKLLTK